MKGGFLNQSKAASTQAAPAPKPQQPSVADTGVAAPSGSATATNGIPEAPFIEDVEKFLGGADADVAPTLQKFQEAMS